MQTALAQSPNAQRQTSLVSLAEATEVWAQIKQLLGPTTGINENYSWFSLQNREAALQHVQAAQLAHHHGLNTQFGLNTEIVLRYFTKDLAERTQDLVRRDLGYAGQIYYHPDNLALASTFDVHSRLTRTTTQNVWRFQPASAFTQMIPLEALLAMTVVDEGATPAQSYWVADMPPKQVTQPRNRDPLLYARYGRWFANIAAWI